MVMQLVNSHLRKNPWNDNKVGASRFIIICHTWEKKQRNDDELRTFIVIYYTWKKKQRNDDKLGRFAVIYYTWGKKKDDDKPGRLAVICYISKKKQTYEDEPLGLLSSSTLEKKKEKDEQEWKINRKKKVDGHLFATNALVIFWRSVFSNTTSATSSTTPFQHCFYNIVFCNIASTPPLQYFLL